MKGSYKQLKELHLSHIFYMHFIFSFLIGGGAIYILCKIALPHFIPVVVYMMYYLPLARISVHMYFYHNRNELNSLPEDIKMDGVMLYHTEWNAEFSKTIRSIRLNILFLTLGIFTMKVFLIADFFAGYHAGEIFTQIILTGFSAFLLWHNVTYSMWLREEILDINKGLL